MARVEPSGFNKLVVRFSYSRLNLGLCSRMEGSQGGIMVKWEKGKIHRQMEYQQCDRVRTTIKREGV